MMSNTSTALIATKILSQNINYYFYNREDRTRILSLLSPWRSTIEKIIPFLHYLGIVNNFICILVFSRKNFLRRKSIFYLLLLAFADLMYNFSSVLPTFLISTNLLHYNIYKTSDISCFIYDYGITSFHFYSVSITLLITIDRYDHLNRSLKLYRKLADLKDKKIMTLSLLLICLVIALPHGFLMVYNESEKDCDARAFFRKSIKSLNLTYYQLYFTFTEPFFIWFLPGILITYMNSNVVYKIFKTNEIYSKKFTVNFRPIKKIKGNVEINDETQINISPINHRQGKTLRNYQLQLKKSESCSELNKLNNFNSTANEQSFDKFSMYYNTEKNSVDIARSLNKSSFNKNSLLNINDIIDKSFSENDIKQEKTSIASVQNLNLREKTKKLTLSVNQLSHYLTIVTVGFYFILSTIPYAIILSLQNNLTLKLNYSIQTQEDYLNDYLWIKYGNLREWVAIFRIFFMSNHCFNLFLYLLFNRLFRKTFIGIFRSMKNSLKNMFYSEESSSYL